MLAKETEDSYIIAIHFEGRLDEHSPSTVW
jgi:hypothetical protein